MTKSRKTAPVVSIDAARDVVVITGQATWHVREGGLDPVRARTPYRIEIPVEGSPFDPDFVLPRKGTVETLARDGALSFGVPLARRGAEAADDERVVLYRLSEKAAPDALGTEVLGVKGPRGEVSLKGIEGTFKSAAMIGFNAKMTAVTEVSILLQAKLTDADGDVSRGLLLGVDVWKGGVAVGAAGGAAAGGGTGLGGDVGAISGAAVQGRAGDALAGGDEAARGGAGDDLLRGRSGDDDLRGGRGADRLHDGAGEDLLRGGRGADVFVLSQDGARDAIADFDPDRDAVDLTAFGPGLGFEDLEIVARDGALILRLGGEALEIHGARGPLAAGDLDPDGFLFA
ncbi:MAG: hypothetical protein ACU0DT_02375 [Albimonas sp.]|uniref:hypothetical protein n=1 Tax=Albimonas sp. TaxID=1872425 RepID=UPI00405700F7